MLYGIIILEVYKYVFFLFEMDAEELPHSVTKELRYINKQQKKKKYHRL